VDHLVIVSSPGFFAAGMMTARPGRLSNRARALIVGDPRLSGKMAERYPELPDARREAQTVAGHFRNHVLLVGRAASERAVTGALAGAELFHFAGHGVSTHENGMLLLAGEGESEATWLDSERVESLLGQCRLAVLSACNSANGQLADAFNPASLIQAFWRAGVPEVVAMRWVVDSNAASRIMTVFYRELEQGARPAAALRQAASELRRDRRFAHPAFWAGFHVFSSLIS
jgi:CHAT domain-containing protein